MVLKMTPRTARSSWAATTTSSGATPKDENIYRFVASPRTLQWWIGVPEHVGWVHLDLARFFSGSPGLTVPAPR